MSCRLPRPRRRSRGTAGCRRRTPGRRLRAPRARGFGRRALALGPAPGRRVAGFSPRSSPARRTRRRPRSPRARAGPRGSCRRRRSARGASRFDRSAGDARPAVARPHRVAGLDADPHGLSRSADRERGVQRAHRVILVAHGHAERGRDRLADNRLDPAAGDLDLRPRPRRWSPDAVSAAARTVTSLSSSRAGVAAGRRGVRQVERGSCRRIARSSSCSAAPGSIPAPRRASPGRRGTRRAPRPGGRSGRAPS